MNKTKYLIKLQTLEDNFEVTPPYIHYILENYTQQLYSQASIFKGRFYYLSTIKGLLNILSRFMTFSTDMKCN